MGVHATLLHTVTHAHMLSSAHKRKGLSLKHMSKEMHYCSQKGVCVYVCAHLALCMSKASRHKTGTKETDSGPLNYSLKTKEVS